MVELCKDRVTALVDRDAVEMTRSHCAKVKLTGVPDKKVQLHQISYAWHEMTIKEKIRRRSEMTRSPLRNSQGHWGR